MSNANHHQDSLGLPAPQRPAAGTSPLDAPLQERDGYEYRLPDRILNTPAWERYAAGKFTADDLTFVMGEPTTKDEADAAKFAPNNTVGMLNRLEQYCLLRIGNRPVRRNQDLLDNWYKAIGRQGRSIVESAFLKMYQIDPAEVEQVLAAGKPITV
jgi:hypothetical protein